MRSGTFGSFSNTRYNNFNFLRFAFATLVVCSHSFALLYGARGWEPINALTRGQMTGGDLAVDLFFVISGFLIAKSWAQSASLTDFLAKRVRRIYPGFAMALAFCVFVVGPIAIGFRHLGGYLFSPSTLLFFKPLALLPGSTLPHVFDHNPFMRSVNGSLWTIRFEFGCYLMIAVFGTLGLLKNRKATLGAFIAALVVYQLQLALHRSVGASATVAHLPRFVSYYLAGTVFYLYRNNIPFSRNLFAIACVLVAAGCFGLMDLAMPLAGTYALFYLAFDPNVKLQQFGARADVSYGIYLYAYPVQQLLVLYFGANLNPATLFACAFPITCVLAHLSWRFVERPFLIRSRGAAAVRTLEGAAAVA